jgi:hypothetical protein
MRRNVFYDPDNDYYEVIGVAPNADVTTIQRAYRAKAKQFHPDVNQDRHEWAKERFQLLNEAYSVLNDTEKRRLYDNLRWPFQFHSSGNNAGDSSRQSTSQRARPSWHYEERPYQEHYRPPKPQPFTQASPRQQPQRAIWLNELHLGWLKPIYIGMVDLIESPYRYVLLFVGLLLAVNVVLVAAGVWQSKDGSDESNVVIVATNTLNVAPPINNPNLNTNIIPTQTAVPSVTPVIAIVATDTPQPTATETATLQPSEMACHPEIEIFSPLDGQTIYRHSPIEEVEIIGRIAVVDMFTYSVQAHLIDVTSSPVEPIELRARLSQREAPIENNTIATLDALRYVQSGAYQVVIMVWDDQQVMLGQCSLVVVKAD